MKKVKRFTFGEYIKKLPAKAVFKYLVKQHNAEKSKIISSRLIDSIEKEYASAASCNARFEGLSPGAKKICVLTYLFGAGGLKALDCQEYHKEILHSFLLYSAHDKYTTSYYFGFTDSEEILLPACASFLFEHARTSTAVKPVPFLRRRCLSDFGVILLLALRGSLKKKRDGGLIAASVTELKKLLHATSEICVFEKKGEDTKSIIQLLLAYGTKRGYLVEDEKLYLTTHEQITLWLALSYEELYDDFIEFAIAYTGGWSRVMFEETLTLADSTWLSASFFPVSCRKQVRDMLQVLHYTGIIEADSSGDDLLWRRCSVQIDFTDFKEKQKVIILPDFSAVLPQEVPPEVLYAFAQLGILSNLDRIYKGTVDRDMVNESLSRGISGDVLLAHLSGWETPVNVIETVKEWIREFSRLSVLCRETIVTFDEKTSRQIGSYPALETLIEPVNAQAVFAIKKGYEKETRDILEAMGFDPRVPEIKHLKPASAQHLVLGVSFEELTLADNFDITEKKVSRSVASGKYSEELKELEVNELFHVIDYTILMGHLLKIEYEGSPYIRQGEYTITPLKIINDSEPFVEGKTKGSNDAKKYYIKKIKKIGVLS